VPPAVVQSILSVLDVPGAETAQPGDFIDNHFVDALDRSGFIRQVGAADSRRGAAPARTGVAPTTGRGAGAL
jgi:hypothetical protein